MDFQIDWRGLPADAGLVPASKLDLPVKVTKPAGSGAVRLTLLNHRRVSDSTIEIVCDGEVIECPLTTVPRQEALCLAMLMDVLLIKVYGRDFPDVSERVDKLTSGGV